MSILVARSYRIDLVARNVARTSELELCNWFIRRAGGAVPGVGQPSTPSLTVERMTGGIKASIFSGVGGREAREGAVGLGEGEREREQW